MSDNCCCCNSSTETMNKNTNESLDKLINESVPELISSAEDTFNMEKTLTLTESAMGLWELHKSVINETIRGGWDNKVHPWSRDRQDFWRYPLAFGSYGIPSLIMIDNSKYQEAVDCLRKSILLMKDVGAWDEWTRLEFGKDPVTTKNVMYKGHLNLLYGLYKLISGHDEFETEHHRLTEIMTTEMDYNSKNRGFHGIECEPDQYFPPCNSIGIMSLKVYDKIYHTDLDMRFGIPTADFIKNRVSDPKTGLPFFRYHPSHDQAEAYLTNEMWTLGMLHIYDPAHFERAYDYSKKLFIGDLNGGKECYLKASQYSEGASSDYEQSTMVYYVPFGAKEYNDPALWEKINRYFRHIYETEIVDGTLRFHDVPLEEETIAHCYLFLGDVHLGWDRILNYDWNALQQKIGVAR